MKIVCLEELHGKSSRFASKGFLFDPLPLVRVGTEHEIGDVRALADLIMGSLRDDKVSEKKSFARILLETLILNVLHHHSKSFTEVEDKLGLFAYEEGRLIDVIKEDTGSWSLDRWRDYITNDPTDVHPEIAHNYDFLKNVKPRIGLIALLAMNAIRLYRLSSLISQEKGTCVCGAAKSDFLKNSQEIVDFAFSPDIETKDPGHKHYKGCPLL